MGVRQAVGAAGPSAPVVGVMQITDSLQPGGLERVAVNLGNLIPRGRYRSFLCATRQEGPLAALVSSDVQRLALGRTRRVDIPAMLRLSAYLTRHDIGILHAHGTSLFIAAAVSLLPPYPAVVWHDHFGAARIAARPARAYRWALRRVAAVIAVNPLLAEWSRTLGVPAERVHYIPNFVAPPTEAERAGRAAAALPGPPGARAVCVAQFRPQKDHLTLIRAWAIVHRHHRDAHLILIGGGADHACAAAVRAEIERLDLGAHVTALGERSDARALMRDCDVGVLSSASEGFPLVLLEYAMEEVAAISTNVGQCAEVLDHGAAGVLVEPGSPQVLAEAILTLLGDATLRTTLRTALRVRAQQHYTSEPILKQVCAVYDSCRPTSSYAQH